MGSIDQLLEISEKLGRNDISLQLVAIKQRQQEKNTELIVPLVGEYSAGKTSILNSLTTTQLETAIVPTTATLFEVRFSYAQVKAIVNNDDGASYEFGLALYDRPVLIYLTALCLKTVCPLS
jgi:GTPase SAR1 family protein